MSNDDVLLLAGLVLGHLHKATERDLREAAESEGLSADYRACVLALADARQRLQRTTMEGGPGR